MSLRETFYYGDLSVPLTTPPPDYAASIEAIAPNITALAESNSAPGESWFDSLAKVLPAVIASDAQRKLLNVQIERARAGLPPLDTSDYGVGVRVGLSEDSKQLLIYGGVGLALLIGFGIIKFGRR